jgi:uncharacterized protein (DUF1330 family)
MTAYLLAVFRVEDRHWEGEYRQNVPAIMQKHGGEYILVADDIKRYEGDSANPDGIVLCKFPSMAAMDAFVSDAEYEPYKSARLAATSGDVFGLTPLT